MVEGKGFVARDLKFLENLRDAIVQNAAKRGRPSHCVPPVSPPALPRVRDSDRSKVGFHSTTCPTPSRTGFLILVGCSEGSFGSVAALAGITTGMSTPRSPARAALGLAMCGPRQVHLVVGLHARFTLSCNLLLRRLSPFVRLQPSAGRLRLRRRP